MLRSRIIPCLLIRNRGLVKTTKFKNDKYVGDPINAVKIFNEKEVDELTILDIDVTSMSKDIDYDQLEKIAVESNMPLCYGGGISNVQQAEKIISLGFEKISISAAAIERPQIIQEIAQAVGTQSVVVTCDLVKTIGGYRLTSHNNRKKYKLKWQDFVSEATHLGAGEIVINNVTLDGTMKGYDIDLAKEARSITNVPLTIIGGAGTTLHMENLISKIGICGAAAGSMFVFNGPYRAVLISYSRPTIEIV